MSDKEDYLTSYRVFFETFAATVNPEDQLPVHIAGYTITEAELPGEVLYWTTQYLTEKQCPQTLMTPLRRIILDEVRVASKKQPNDFGYKADEAVYIALRLMQAVTARVIDVCLRYLDNSRLDSLPPPPPLSQRDMKTVSCATKNSRRVMEDRHVEIGNLEALFGIETTETTSFYAVYDGHAGSAAATYCAAHLHQYMVESPYFKTDLQRAMRDAFLRTDAEFVRKSNQERACGGSTAVTVAVRGRRLLAAWAGDSLALLAKRMRLMQLVRPHKPGRQDERDRIESSGGTVMYWGTWRVNGQLAVSRAIGDAQYKPYVTARPEIATVDLDGDEDFVVVACDGLWDFVSEDDVALAVYRQLAIDPHDLKAVTKRLVVQAKRQGSADNISIIVVFLKDPRDIAADNRPPMELGLDNALANAPPFTMEPEACKRPSDGVGGVGGADGECADADNGLDNSDSDSEDLGPETAVDADDIDAERNQPAAPTPPADAVEDGHVDGALVDNVAESGEESEDEWNYIKGEGEREEHDPSEEPDEPQRSPTPCQDNSAWETSSVDMNSSPLNPDAPVFVPGSVGADVLLAESPRKPVPMDDIELPDVAQFQTEAVVRPAELLDLDNCDQLNGHHNISLDEAGNEHFNGNEKCNMDSLGFGFGVGVESEKIMDTSLIQDFERIQKDTTDFCNIQVFQTHTETNPFVSDGNDELFERLKNKERDPMSMSFYQEKDDDTCERLAQKESHVDLNAVQPLPDSDDDDIQPNGLCDNTNEDKENVSPDQQTDLISSDIDNSEPNNDIMRFDCRTDIIGNDDNFGQDNFMDYNVENTNNMQNYSNVDFESSNLSQNTVLQTDTPESHKLLFEQIPEIPDGKSSELGFVNEDTQDPSESEKDGRAFTPQEETSQDVDMESKFDDSPCVEEQPVQPSELNEDHKEAEHTNIQQQQTVYPESGHHIEDKENEIMTESALSPDDNQLAEQFSHVTVADEKLAAISPEVPHDTRENVIVDIHQHNEMNFEADDDQLTHEIDDEILVPKIKLETDQSYADVPMDDNLIPIGETPVPAESPLPSQSPLPSETLPPSQSPMPTESPLPSQSPMPTETVLASQSAVTVEAPLSDEHLQPAQSPSPLASESPTVAKSPTPVPSPVPESFISAPTESVSPAPPAEVAHSLGVESPSNSAPAVSPVPQFTQPLELSSRSPLPAEVPLPRESPPPADSPFPAESPLPVESSLPIESSISREELLATDVSSLVDLAPTSPSPALRPETATPTGASPVPGVVEAACEAFEDRSDDRAIEARLSPEVSTEAKERSPSRSDDIPTEDAISGPAPDIVPEGAQQSRGDLVTDIDIGIPESRAQEICMPVTSEIHLDDGVQPGAATPPPTPAVDPAAPASAPLDIPPLSETPIAADVAPAAIAAAAAATVAAAAAATIAGVKSKTPAKKSPTTPTATAKPDARKPAVKSAASPRVPAAAPKKTPAATPPAKPAAARTSTTATKAPTPVSKAPTPTAKSTAPAARTSVTAPKTTAAAARTSISKPATTTKSPTAVRETAVTAKSVAAPRSAPSAAAGRPASAPRPAGSKPPPPVSAARPAAAARPASAGAPRPPARAAPAPRPPPAPSAARPLAKPKTVPEKKPLANGDVKEPTAPRRPPISRPTAPRAPPRAAPAAPAAPASQTTKSAVPKPAPRATKPLDKQTKDLANKRITAKAAPPRTATAKAPTAVKSTAAKAVPKKCIESAAKEPAKEPPRAALTNGAAEAPSKPPPSPPAADNALLPDVIA